jgi:4-methylaminobutanoate oxidase (formaldehyde-forming)
MIEAGEPINQAYLKDARWEIDIAGKRYPAEVSLRPLYDPEMAKIRS